MKKSIFLFFAAILCAMTANAYNQAAKDLYFDNSEAKWEKCYVYIGKGDYTSCYDMTRVPGTQYLWQLPANFNGGNSWNGATGWVVCYEKWWASSNETIDKYIWHGDNNVTKKSTSAWVDTKIYKTNGAANATSDGTTKKVYTVTSYTKNNYTVTINTVEGGTLTVNDYDNNAVATGASKIHLTVLKFSAAPASGYVLEGVQINDGSTTTTISASEINTKTHTLTSNVTITPVWKATTSTVTVTTSATNGTVTGGGVVEEGTSVTLTATPATGYQFKNWTVAGTEVSTANPYTFTANEDVTVTANFEETPKATIYFVNNSGWSKIQAYAWGDKGSNASWAGVDITANKLSEKIGEFDVYSYTVEQGLYANVIFNNGSAQTKDYVWIDGNYYWNNEAKNFEGGTKADAETKFSVPVEYDYVYFINTNSWAAVNIYTWDSEIATWPGVAMNKEAEQIAGFDVYSHKEVKGTTFGGMKFNEGKDKAETGNLTWQAGKYYAPSKDKWYDTKEAAEEALATPLADETVYFVNNKQWANVAIYGWGGTASTSEGIGKWAGADMTKTAEQVAGFDVYSYTAKEGTVKNILFNYNGDENKTSNFVWTDGKYYYMGAAENYAGGTKEEVAVLVTPDPLATEVYLAGDMTNKDNWDVNKKEFRKATADATNASVTVTLEAQTYKFKLVIDGAWKGNTGTMQRGGDAVHEGGWSFDKDGYDDNCQIVADIAGDYTFTWNLTDKKLTVTYPPLPKYTVTATAENGSVTGAGEYEQGSEATLVATPDAGYAFKNWTKEGEVVSTEATYTFTVTTNVELVANFVLEETHEVTVSYLCNGTPIPGQTETKLAVGVTTPSTITAPTIKNYKFDSWTLGTGVQSADATTANPIQITTLASGEYTLAANYTKIELTYTVEVPAGTEKCYIRGGFDDWDKFHEMELKDGETNVFTLTIDGAVTTDEYKYACQESWEYKELDKEGNDIANRTWTALDKVEKWAEPTEVKYVLMGVNGDWTNGIPLTVNPDNADEYVLTDQVIIKATDAIKVVTLTNGVATAWCGDVDSWSNATHTADADGNIVLEDGIYTFYFKKTANNIYINQTGYARNVTNTYGTICLPYASASTSGATFYEVVGKETGKVYLGSVTTLAAGVPYIFEKSASQIKVVYTGDKENAPVNTDANGLVGTFEEIAVPNTAYILYNDAFRTNNDASKPNKIRAYRAYLNLSAVEGGKPGQPMPGRRYIGMSVQGENEATGVEDLFTTDAPVKVIENGQLIIIRDGVKYNVQGQKL